MTYTLVRNATATLQYGGMRFLIDPALDPARARPTVPNTPNQQPNPLVELPDRWEDVTDDPSAQMITHLHTDHFDDTAAQLLDHGLPVFCQPEDVGRLRNRGFRALRPIDSDVSFGNVHLTRTAGRHGTGEIGKRMAPVSGFVFKAPGEPVVYVAGDTIWCDEVAQTIATHQPDVIVVNAGGARFLEGDPIVMTAEDIVHVHDAAPGTTLIVVHLEAINHCLETRDHYRERLPALGVNMDRVRIPGDGESVIW